MAIGDLYGANNVVVGQAAVFFAPNNTPLPSFAVANGAGWNQADPFDPAFFLSYALTITSATSLTLTVNNEGLISTTTSLTVAGLTATQIVNALAALPAVGLGNVKVTNAASPWNIVFMGDAMGSTLTVTPTGGTASIASPVWLPCGATDQGWQFSADKSTQTINIEEQSTPIATTITSQNVSLVGALSEDITRTLNVALNATSAAVAAVGSTVPGYDLVTMTDIPILYAVALVTTNSEGYGRIIYAPSWTQLANANPAFRRASDKRSYGVQFQTVCKTSQIQTYNFVVPHA